MTSPAIAAVIPTRGRREVALQAIRSLLDQDCPIEIFVSDNSALPDEELRDFCRAPAAVHYLRPPREMLMAAHWDWAVRQAMERSGATHFTVHYDRKITKPRHLGMARAIAAKWPDRVLTWSHDAVSDTPPPLRLWQAPWTGNVFSLRSERLVQLTAAGRAGAIWSHALPLLSNCLVPREVLSDVIARFGDLCDSTTPDSCFAYRFFTLRAHYLHFDRALAVVHAPQRSTGLGYVRGGGGDFDDFGRMWGDRPWLADAPLPGLTLGLNMLYHEYERVRRATGEQLPPVARAAYLDDLASGLPLVTDRATRAQLRHALQRGGWRARDLRGRLRFFVRHRVLGALDRHFGIRFRRVQGRAVTNDEEALRMALHDPLPRQTTARHLALLDPVEVGAA